MTTFDCPDPLWVTGELLTGVRPAAFVRGMAMPKFLASGVLPRGFSKLATSESPLSYAVIEYQYSNPFTTLLSM